MNIFRDTPQSWNVKWWARLLALLFLVAFGVAAYGVMRVWQISGNLPISFPGVIPVLVFGYVVSAIGWVGITGKVPRFFPIGALRWPFFRPVR